ncbi:hypothetical protein [Variovorax soli]|jgi:hypothetical protein|uniref:hypothetical protein n=1 Tax=Variovorax soli TaxID=376815 RepID=UPI000A02664F|nr:hypothetical protein [Variovorax soli]
MRFDCTHSTPASLPAIVILAALALFSGAAVADDDDRWRGGESKQKYRDGPCKVEEETKKSGEYKRKTECKDGGAAAQNGEWKREFRDGPCKVKQEAKHDGYKEEVECKGRK